MSRSARIDHAGDGGIRAPTVVPNIRPRPPRRALEPHLTRAGEACRSELRGCQRERGKLPTNKSLTESPLWMDVRLVARELKTKQRPLVENSAGYESALPGSANRLWLNRASWPVFVSYE